MKKNRPSAAYLSAVVAGLIAGSAFAGSALAQDKAAPSNTPAASQKDKNACGGPNGCGSKKAGEVLAEFERVQSAFQAIQALGVLLKDDEIRASLTRPRVVVADVKSRFPLDAFDGTGITLWRL